VPALAVRDGFQRVAHARVVARIYFTARERGGYTLPLAVLGRPFRLVSFVIVAAVSAPAPGATPCSDEPGFAGLACRVAGLAELAGAAEPHLRRRVDALAARLAPAMDACARGSTQAARGGLQPCGGGWMTSTARLRTRCAPAA
jgi:hypothetical protein